MHRPVMQDGGRRRRLARMAVVATGLFVASCSSDLPQSSLNPKSVEAQQIDDLWKLVLYLAIAVFIVVELALVVAIFWFRKRKNDDKPEPKQTHGNTRLEILWSIIPALILVVIAVPTLQTLFDLSSPPEGDFVRVNVTGHQWWWEFEYPDFVDASGRPLTTANELHLPVGVTTELKMTSADVIHSFWVPPLAGKRDVVPGLETFIKITPDANRDGEVIPGQCAEFCWLSHADMRTAVFLETEADFATWAQQQLQPATIPTDGPAASGYEIFTAICSACHQAAVAGPDGVSVVGEALAPDLTHFGSRTTLGARVLDNTAEHLAQWIDDPSSVKPMAPELNDFGSGRILGMPDYGLDEEEIAELVALLEGWK